MSREQFSSSIHNKILESSYKLTLIEQKIVLAGISQINTAEKQSKLKYFTLSVSDIAESANLDNNNYTHLKQSIKKLYERSVVIENYGNGVCVGTTHTRWFSDISYRKDEAEIRIEFAEKIISHLSDIQNHFVKYRYKEVVGMKSIYSIRLYELLVQWLGEGAKLANLEWLKEQLQVSDKYQRFTSLRDRVLDIAVEEINKKTSLIVSYKTKKTGKFITHILFTVSREENQALVGEINPQKMFDDTVLKTEEQLQVEQENRKEQERLLKQFDDLEAENQARFLLYFMEHISGDNALSESYRNEGLDNAAVKKEFINYLGSG